ncbi:nucleotidyltransferase domain-containing protein [Chondromyces crocatus]|uniref:Nucleotidyltransferase n=1 Tax=Chondromyces crocatus TaxID=52 RepID=A0A0K1EPC7_CHOCO|nr:nucleotidyltransferase domain-containing protein [Chondromyces crocatus]AKT42664.1 uncharacterized protein CMC5_068910 [Chondromyces crocatus]
MNMTVLDARQQIVADRVLDEEERQRAHLVVSLSGAHAYGFPSPDSDLDLKSIHIEPTRRLLGLMRSAASPSRLEIIDGVEVDYSSNEIHPVLLGVLQGNGNYIERILGPFPLRTAPELDALKPLCLGALSRRVFRHYLGFATSQRHAWEASERASVKKLLYVLRTALTGAHALTTGTVVTDVTLLLDQYGFSSAHELIDIKRSGERSELPENVRDRWAGEIGRAFTTLTEAHERSPLPEEPPNADALDEWLLTLRRARF